MTTHHPDCDVYQATLASEGPYGDPDVDPTEYECLSECDPDSLLHQVAFLVAHESIPEQIDVDMAAEIIHMVLMDFYKAMRED